MMLQATCTADVFEAAQPCAVAIVLRVDRALTSQDEIVFQFPNSWSLIQGPSFSREFQHSNPSGAHYVAVGAPGCDAEFEVRIATLPLESGNGQARHPRRMTARLKAGTVPPGTDVRIDYANTVAPYIADREEVRIWVNGEAVAAPPVLTVRGGAPAHLRVLAPSSARPGEPVELLIVSLDRFDNVSNAGFEGERLFFEDGSVAADDLRFRGSLRVACRFDRPGVHRVRFRETWSNAIRVGEGPPGPFWGDLHIHTKLSHDAQGGEPYGYAREVSGLDFAAAADHWESLGEEGYRTLARWAAAACAPGRFVAFRADERNPKELTGHHNVYFAGSEPARPHQAIRVAHDATRPNSFARLRDGQPDEVMLIPHHTGIAWGELRREGIGSAVDWDICDDGGLRPVMEIYSHHGQSELYAPAHVLAYELNRMRNPERRSNTSVPGPFYAQDYWMRGKRIGVIASSDEHSGQGGRRHGGIAAVFAEDLTRSSLFDALRRRRCYATTGERILVEFSIDGLEMGEAGLRDRGDRLAIRFNVWGTETLLRVELLRYRFGVDAAFIPIYSSAPRPENRDACVAMEDAVDGPCMYYVRAMQEPLAWPGMAWSSPIWVDVSSEF